MSRVDVGACAGIAALFPALWLMAYLLHLYPIEQPLDQWWYIPWFFTVVAVGIAVIVLAVVTSLTIYGDE